MPKVGDLVRYERQHELRTGEKYSGKGKIIGSYIAYVIVDCDEMDKPAPYTHTVHEKTVTALPSSKATKKD